MTVVNMLNASRGADNQQTRGVKNAGLRVTIAIDITRLQTKITQNAKERGMRKNTKGVAQIKMLINSTFRMQTHYNNMPDPKTP